MERSAPLPKILGGLDKLRCSPRIHGYRLAVLRQRLQKVENGRQRLMPSAIYFTDLFFEKFDKFPDRSPPKCWRPMSTSRNIESRILTIGVRASALIAGCIKLTAALTPITPTAHPEAHSASLTELDSNQSVFCSRFAKTIRNSDSATRKPRKRSDPMTISSRLRLTEAFDLHYGT